MRALFLTILKKCRQLHCKGLLRSRKLVHLGGKKIDCFTRKSVQILMNLVFFSKGTESVQKTAKTKVVRKNANWRSSEAKGKETGRESARSPKDGF